MNIFAFEIGNLGGPDLFIILLIVFFLFGAEEITRPGAQPRTEHE